jgi:hypothetical protein
MAHSLDTVNSILIKTEKKVALDELDIIVSTSKIQALMNSLVVYDSEKLTSQNFDNIISNMWSHIVWSVCDEADHAADALGKRHRHASHFESTQLLVLDFDNKENQPFFSVNDAKEFCEEHELLHFVTPTGSHQSDVDKYGNKCHKTDKFRIILFLNEPIKDVEKYKLFYKEMLKLFTAADPSASDAARHWCPAINKFNPSFIEKRCCANLESGYTLSVPDILGKVASSARSGATPKASAKTAKTTTKTTKKGGDNDGNDNNSEEDEKQERKVSLLQWFQEAKFVPGSGRNTATFKAFLFLREQKVQKSNAIEYVKSKTIFDSKFTEEKLLSNAEKAYTIERRAKYTRTLTSSTIEGCEDIKFRVASKMFNLDRKDSKYIDEEDIKNTRLFIRENTLYIKSPKQGLATLNCSSQESKLIKVLCRVHKSRDVSCESEKGEVLLQDIQAGVVEEYISLYDIFKDKDFVLSQLERCDGVTYYPIPCVLVDDYVNQYTQPTYLPKDDNFNNDFDLFRRLLSTTVNNNEHYFKWMCNWINHLIRYPHEVLTRHPVILAPQGACKGTLFTVIEGLLGTAPNFNTLSIKGENLLGKDAKFNSVACIENVLICLDELRMTNAMVPELKRLFKNNHQSNFEKKCIQGFRASRTANFLILGNVEENVLHGLKSDERSIYPIKWEDHEFVAGSAKYNKALALYKELEKHMIAEDSVRKILSRQFCSNVYHGLMEMEYSRELLDTPLTIDQKIAAFEDNLSLREQEFISWISEKKLVVFSITDLVKQPACYFNWPTTEQIDFNKNVEWIRKASRQNKLKDLLRRAGYVCDTVLNRTTRVCVYQPFVYVDHHTLCVFRNSKMRYTEEMYSPKEQTRLLKAGDVEVVQKID